MSDLLPPPLDGCIGDALLGDMNSIPVEMSALGMVLFPPASCKCLVLHTKIPPFCRNSTECRKAKFLNGNTWKNYFKRYVLLKFSTTNL